MNFLNQNVLDSDPGKMPKNPKNKKSVYVALSIFLVTLGITGLSTYKSIKKMTMNHSKAGTSQTSQSPAKVSTKSPNELPGKELLKEEEKSINRKPIPEKSPTKEETEEVQEASSPSLSELEIQYPAENNVIKEFSSGKPVYSKTLSDWRTHEGTDFKSETGSAVKAVTSGTVKDIYNDSSYGTTIIIEHDGKFTGYYSGLENNTAVKKGDKVKSGQDLGTIGIVPCEILDGPHLHFMILKDEKFIDPVLILEKENR
ncbi:MAG: M23 family metallopeptidase [Clostridia bacterium]|nr:M23 family metallopeptidase [Clostridia bacterium]